MVCFHVAADKRLDIPLHIIDGGQVVDDILVGAVIKIDREALDVAGVIAGAGLLVAVSHGCSSLDTFLYV